VASRAGTSPFRQRPPGQAEQLNRLLDGLQNLLPAAPR
jgi:hypothetical protein